MHGLLDLDLELLELKGLRSDSTRVLSVAGQREESGELVPSEAEFLIKGIIIGRESADIGAGVGHAEHLRAEDALQAEVEGVPRSIVVCVSLSGCESTSGSKGSTSQEEGTLVVVEFGTY